jgi:hypothetical protein
MGKMEDLGSESSSCAAMVNGAAQRCYDAKEMELLMKK